MFTFLENILMIGQPGTAETQVWALIAAAVMVAASVLSRTPRN